jgi:hypothetical protein
MEEGVSLDWHDQEDPGIETLRGDGYMTCKEKKTVKRIIIVGVSTVAAIILLIAGTRLYKAKYQANPEQSLYAIFARYNGNSSK